MKFLVILACIALASAKEFMVEDPSINKTCILLQVEGTLDVSASNGTESKGSMSLSFNSAKLLNSSDCSVLKLDLGNSTQFWFKQQKAGKEFEVVPISTFNPKAAFKLNETSSPVFQGQPLGSYSSGESYSCADPASQNLTLQGEASQITYTVTLSVSGFKVQFGSIENDTFSPGRDCDGPSTTTPAPTSTSTPAPSSTTAPPSAPTVDFVVNNTAGNVSCIKLEGGFKLAVTYLTTGNKNETYTTVVPKTATATGNCDLTVNSSQITVSFKNDAGDSWDLSYTFSKDDGANYHVSEVAVTYSNLPKARAPGAQTVNQSMPKDYLKASTSGYYTCLASQNVNIQQVTLTTTDLKYKAFNSDANIGFTGDVAECSADDDTNSVVPIAVGAALAGLVVIVLIAYLIGRRRSRKSGYESV